MIYFKISQIGQILDVSSTEKAGYTAVDDTSIFYPFKNWSTPAICCYKISLDGTQITGYTLAVPDKVFYAVRNSKDAGYIDLGDAETLATAYEILGGN